MVYKAFDARLPRPVAINKIDDRLRSGEIRVEILPPIRYLEFAIMDSRQLWDMVREKMREALELVGSVIWAKVEGIFRRIYGKTDPIEKSIKSDKIGEIPEFVGQ